MSKGGKAWQGVSCWIGGRVNERWHAVARHLCKGGFVAWAVRRARGGGEGGRKGEAREGGDKSKDVFWDKGGQRVVTPHLCKGGNGRRDGHRVSESGRAYCVGLREESTTVSEPSPVT